MAHLNGTPMKIVTTDVKEDEQLTTILEEDRTFIGVHTFYVITSIEHNQLILYLRLYYSFEKLALFESVLISALMDLVNVWK